MPWRIRKDTRMNPIDEGKLLQAVHALSTTVARLTLVVERLEARQNYAAGALAGIGVVCSAIGGLAAMVVQWIHK
jgi:hypothetical protein